MATATVTFALSTVVTEETTLSPNDIPQLSIPQSYFISQMFYNYSRPFVLVFGLIGNTLSAIIFFQRNMRKSLSALFFRLIAISESIFLLCDILPTLIEQYTGIETMERTTFLCQIWN